MPDQGKHILYKFNSTDLHHVMYNKYTWHCMCNDSLLLLTLYRSAPQVSRWFRQWTRAFSPDEWGNFWDPREVEGHRPAAGTRAWNTGWIELPLPAQEIPITVTVMSSHIGRVTIWQHTRTPGQQYCKFWSLGQLEKGDWQTESRT